MSVTIIDVANKANVSKSTASRVLAGDVYGVSERARQKVLTAAEELGYVKNTLAMAMRTTRTNTILLIIPDITNSFWSDVVRGAQDYLDKLGYSLILANSDWQSSREEKYLDMVKSHRVDAVMINSPAVDYKKLYALKCPVVIMGDKREVSGFPIVGTDSAMAVSDAMDYLYEMGHRRISMVHPITNDCDDYSDSVRLKGYLNFLSSKGIQFDESLIHYAPLTVESGIQYAEIVAEMENRPSAVLCGNDLVAIGFIQEIARLGLKVPNDISVMGMDDNMSCGFISPKITTVRKYPKRIGEFAAQIATDIIEERPVPEKVLLPVTLVERESVRRL